MEGSRMTRLPDSSDPVKKTLMMNTTRRRILTLLCNTPCQSVAEIARTLRTSRANASWHLEKMVAANFLTKKRFGGGWVFFPYHFIDDDDVPVLTVLADPFPLKVYQIVSNQPNISQSDLRKALNVSRQALAWHISKLLQIGLIENILDGRYKRYRITNYLDSRTKRHQKRTAIFKGLILRSLRKDGTDPVIVKSLTRTLVVKLRVGKGSSVLEVNLDPFHVL
jgi:DNA-binding MarR family transcriptional regulator